MPRFQHRNFRIVSIIALGWLVASAPAVFAQTYSVPIRWCIVGEDLNGNGVADPGERGAPAFTNPGNVGEPDTDNVLWRRHERASENTLIPDASITLRSSLSNIVDADDLHFPIIPDPAENVSGLPNEEYGDIHTDLEGNQIIGACAQAWVDLGMGNDGVMVINVNRLLTTDFVNGSDDDPFKAVGEAVLGSNTVIIRDNAYLLPGSAMIPEKFDELDDVDKHLTHEVGHALNIDGFAGVSFNGLSHTCEELNFMSTGRNDLDGDGLADNFEMSTSIDQIRFAGDMGECTSGEIYDEDVDQVAAMRHGAQQVSGCKIAGTDTDCTNVSDQVVDRLDDAAADFIDLNLVSATLTEDGQTIFRHGQIDFEVVIDSFATYDSISYWILADVDDDQGSGGGADALTAIDAEPLLEGVDLVTRVTRLSREGRPVTEATAWRWDTEMNRFVEMPTAAVGRTILHPRIIDFDDGATTGAPYAYSVEVSVRTSEHAAFADQSRLQAVIVGHPSSADAEPDLDYLAPDKGGISLVPPVFPVCTVSGAVAPGENFTVTATGLVADRPAHAAIGDVMMPDEVAADAAGDVTMKLTAPTDFRPGDHLVTVGTVGTALTADCIVEVRRDGRGGVPPWAWGIIVVAVIVVLIVVVYIVRRRGGGGTVAR